MSEVLDSTRELVRLEVALARDDVATELGRAKIGAVALGVSAGVAFSAFTMLMAAIALSFARTWLAALILGAILLAVAVVLALFGRDALPKAPLALTAARMGQDLRAIEERSA
ncbi:MAG: phage holin family protein [Polyangiaceae bacterium]